MTPGGIAPRCKLNQYDDDWTIVFSLYSDAGEFTIQSGTTAKIRGTKKDGLGYSANATIDISNQKVTVTGDKQITAVAGENTFELVLYKGEKELSTANVIFYVEPAAMDAGTLVSDSKVQEILNMSADVIAASNNVSTLRGNFAPAYSSSATYAVGDYAMYNNQLYRCITAITTAEAWTAGHWTAISLGGDVGNLKNDMNNVVLTYIEFDAISGEYVNKSDGAFIANANWIRTDYIEVDPTKALYATVRATWNAAYDEGKNYLYNFETVAGIPLVFQPNVKYIAISRRTADGLGVLYYKTGAENIEKVDSILTFGDSNGILPLDRWKNCTINSSGNEVYRQDRITSDYIRVEPSSILNVTYKNQAYRLFFTEYTEGKTVIRQSNYLLQSVASYAISTNTHFIRATVAKYPTATENISIVDVSKLGCIVSKVSIINSGLSPAKFRLMEWNIGKYAYGVNTGIPSDVYDEKVANLKRFFADINADVMCLCEYAVYLDRDQAVSADAVLFDPLYKYKFQDDTDSGINTIKSNYVLLDVSTDKLTSDSRTKYKLVHVCAGGKNVALLLVHLHPTDASIQQAEMQAAVALLAGEEYAIMCGDYNFTTVNRDSFFGIATAAGFTLSNGGYFGWEGTWQAKPDISTYKTWFIDNILFKGNIKLSNYVVIDDYDKLCSDHCPTYADLLIF